MYYALLNQLLTRISPIYLRLLYLMIICLNMSAPINVTEVDIASLETFRLKDVGVYVLAVTSTITLQRFTTNIQKLESVLSESRFAF